jgi:uncharacterized protein YeaO (DUF488 family)
MFNLAIKRVYEAPAADDGMRILVDRLWPRGIAKDKAGIDLWLKDIAPSDALRKRFHGKEEDWEEFRKAYAQELKGETAQAAAKILLDHLRSGPVTLLYAARDERHNNALALQAWLKRKAKKKLCELRRTRSKWRTDFSRSALLVWCAWH